MLRPLFTLLAAVSLLVCVATCALWIWSDLSPNKTHALFGGDNLNLRASGGYIVYTGPPQATDTATIFEMGSGNSTSSTTPGPTIFFIKCWKIIWPSALLPLMCVVFFRGRVKDTSMPHCFVCGYDLRATPNRCPECGSVAKPTPPRAKTSVISN